MTKPFIAFAAPSGGGKTTLVQRLLQKYPQATRSVSTTSRRPRPGEVNGVDYNFVSPEEFKVKITEGDFIEWAEVHGNFYGTSKSFLESQAAAGKQVLIIVDVQGIRSLKAALDSRLLTIFLVPPSLSVLEQRLRSRNSETEAVIQTRLKNAQAELAEAASFDLQVVNDDLEQCFQELCKILESHLV